MTAEQLAALPDDGCRYELVQGELHMMSPAGGQHGRVAWRLGMLIGAFVDQRELGAVYAAETGFLISRDPDTVRAPDLAFVANEGLRRIEDPTRFVPFAPDLAAEVISPNDSFSAVEEKARCWLDAGTKAVLLVDPQNRTVHVYQRCAPIVVLRDDQELEVDEILPGWRIAVAELFR